MELLSLLSLAGIDYPKNIKSVNITQIVSDSRCACVGCLYVCIRGIHNDGHLFVKDAVDQGASAVIIESGAEVEFDNDFSTLLITVTNTRKALACLFNAWYGSPSEKMKFVAVTGTNGKTSVTHVLKKIFETALYRCGLVGTVSCLSLDRQLFSNDSSIQANMTTPDPDILYCMLGQMADDGVEYVFIEASSHALELDKLYPIHFTAAIFTNLTVDHLDFHGSIDKYIAAKKKLFAMSDLTVVNMD
jgi:UDP-N-acetylmuramoyl-L-alanyl-D-glutamate--2,6-diaminopimelate ligase